MRVGDTPVTGGLQEITVNSVCVRTFAGQSASKYHEFVCDQVLSGRYVQLQKKITSTSEYWDINEIYIYALI